jgi:hypothetical protein
MRKQHENSRNSEWQNVGMCPFPTNRYNLVTSLSAFLSISTRYERVTGMLCLHISYPKSLMGF